MKKKCLTCSKPADTNGEYCGLWDCFTEWDKATKELTKRQKRE